MVSIDFGDGYKIWTPDEYNVVLIREDVVTNPKAKNYGKTVERRMGYYGNLEQALNAYKAAHLCRFATWILNRLTAWARLSVETAGLKVLGGDIG